MLCQLLNVEFRENISNSLEFLHRTKGPKERDRERQRERD